MKKLLSLPPNLVNTIESLEQLDPREWFCTSDPVGHRVGSGGGTAWLLAECFRNELAEKTVRIHRNAGVSGKDAEETQHPELPAEARMEPTAFSEWLGAEKRILLHAGGQSRRLPAYAPSGKILTPIPVFRWERGQQLNQHLLALQLPLYEQLMAKTPPGLNTLIVSGDVYIRSEAALQDIPQADVVCYGLWTDLSLATRHGVFASRRDRPHRLDFMMQKPSLARLEELSSSHFFLMDIGCWILSDRAVEVLMRRSYVSPTMSDLPGSAGALQRSATGDKGARFDSATGDLAGAFPRYYDLYSDFGLALGDDPSVADEGINSLTVAVLPLPGGEFYHFGTSRELVTSTLAIQNKVYDQRRVLQRKVKPHPAMFVQNAQVEVLLLPQNDTLWIENSWIGPQWQLSREHVITGVPRNDWPLRLPQGMCVDVVPVNREASAGTIRSGEHTVIAEERSEGQPAGRTDDLLPGQSSAFVARPYHIDDAFRGDARSAVWMGVPVAQWLAERGISLEDAASGSVAYASLTVITSDSVASQTGITSDFGASQTGAASFGFFSDFQQARIFPCVASADELGLVLRWMIAEPELAEGRRIWLKAARFSADELSASADLKALYAQRREFFLSNLPVLAANFDRSVFYQTDLSALAREWVEGALPLPAILPETATLLHRMHNRMFRARCLSVMAQLSPAQSDASSPDAPLGDASSPDTPLRDVHSSDALPGGATSPDAPLGDAAIVSSSDDKTAAFQLMREALLAEVSWSTGHVAGRFGITEGATANVEAPAPLPHLSVLSDQIVWSRSPVRIDLAGGWTDTPPYSLYAGGSVVNIAIDLNGQQPLQVYLKPSTSFDIVLRSIDMGASEQIVTYDELLHYTAVGSPFSIPKAALALAGFGRESGFATLRQQLEAFGAGIELTLLAAIPAGSGLGTSSLLASTVLGGLNDFCGLRWDKNEICLRTLALEQLLTTGGGWQDQYGGVLHGVKLLHTEAGLRQSPAVSWLPEFLYTRPGYENCHLLYYTGITRTAKHILSEIVEGMFLNSAGHLRLLAEMKDHATEMAAAIQTGDFTRYARLVSTTWAQNKALDSGTNPPAVEAIIRRVHDFTAGYKLPGAGGGGYLYMVAKDPEAAARIRRELTDDAPNARARFVEMTLSATGLQVSRS